MEEEVKRGRGRIPNDGGIHTGGVPGEPAHNRIVDERKLRELAEAGCSNAEMAAILGVSVAALTIHWRGVIEESRAKLGLTLRQLQISRARKGDTTMLIWLGKQILKQSDKITTVSKISLEGMTDDELTQLDQLLIADGEDETTSEG